MLLTSIHTIHNWCITYILMSTREYTPMFCINVFKQYSAPHANDSFHYTMMVYTSFHYAILIQGYAIWSAEITWCMKWCLATLENSAKSVWTTFWYTVKINSNTLNTSVERLKIRGLACQLKKCHFLLTKVEHLGYILASEGLERQPEKNKAIEETVSYTHLIMNFMN